MNGMVLRSLAGFVFLARRSSVAVLLHQPQMESEQRQEDCRKHHHMQCKEALHGEFTNIRTTTQHARNCRPDKRNRRGNLQTNLGRKVAELIHRQQVTGETEHRRDPQQTPCRSASQTRAACDRPS